MKSELLEDAEDLENKVGELLISLKHTIMIQFHDKDEIVYEEFKDIDNISKAMFRSEELDNDPNVRCYVVLFTMNGKETIAMTMIGQEKK